MSILPELGIIKCSDKEQAQRVIQLIRINDWFIIKPNLDQSKQYDVPITNLDSDFILNDDKGEVSFC